MILIFVAVVAASGGFLIGWAAHGFTEAAVLCEPVDSEVDELA